MIVRESFAKVWDRIREGFFRFGVFHFCVAAVAVLLVLSNHSVIRDAAALNVSRGICWGALAGVFAQLVGEWRNRPLKKHRDRGRWILKYAFSGDNKGWQQYDVTEWVERIFTASGCKGIITRDVKFELTESEALWRLRPDLTFAIGGFRMSGTVGREIRYVSLGKCAVLTVREASASDTCEQR